MPAPLASHDDAFHGRRVDVIGAGRVGRVVVTSLRDAGVEVHGPFGRGARGEAAHVVLLAVPDAAIAAAARLVAPGRTVGHFSGSTTLEPLSPHEALSIHPLTSVTATTRTFAGAPATVAGSTPAALALATELAELLGLQPFHVADADRAAYHAAASVASNFLVTLEAFAQELAATAGVDRAALVPLVRASVEAWAADGPEQALTGPISRGDDVTVARQRAAVAERMPDRLALFDALAAATRELALRGPTDAATDQSAATRELASRGPTDHRAVQPAVTRATASHNPAHRGTASRPEAATS